MSASPKNLPFQNGKKEFVLEHLKSVYQKFYSAPMKEDKRSLSFALANLNDQIAYTQANVQVTVLKIGIFE